ncbi:MAG: YiiD C-terminal domain-containing protein [Spirochaetales bacterium]|nr:YiiD C-terminal domain-containing protein [Spirochaetales bacterium]
MSPEDFEQYIHEHIPVTAAMDFSVSEYSDTRIVLSAPLDTNINHRQSVFGGSISSLLIMSAWAYMYAILQTLGEKGTIVIQNSNVNYYKPIRNDFQAESIEAEKSEYERFVRMLKKFGKSRMIVRSKITEDGEALASFSGSFVVVKKTK